MCPIALITSIKNGIKLQTANTGQNETLHQRVKTIKASEMAPAEWSNVTNKDKKDNHQLLLYNTDTYQRMSLYFEVDLVQAGI